MTTPIIKMPVGKANLEIKKGVTFNPVLHVADANGTAIDYTGYTGRLQIRATHDAATTLDELTTENGGIVCGNGTVEILITAADTAAYTFEKAVYDLELVSPTAVVSCLLEGAVVVKPEVTR